MTQAPLIFNPPTYVPALDGERLKSLLGKVWILMADGDWRTLAEIRAAIGVGSEAGISARLRDVRKMGHTVHRRRRTIQGLWEYRVLPMEQAA